MKKYLKIFLGSFLIGMSLNLFFKDIGLIPSGTMGLGLYFADRMHVNFALTVLLINIFCFLMAATIFPKKYLARCIITFWLIPLFIVLTKDVGNLIDIKDADKLLISLYGGVLMGIGFRCIYSEGKLASGVNVINSLGKIIFEHNHIIILYSLDLILVILQGFTYGAQSAMYSLIAILIMEILSKRASIGINTSKVFYIITKKEKIVKQYIMDELGYDLTEFEVKGGFSKEKNKILMCVIPTRNYYKLREGIKVRDKDAFISITDSYEVINQDVTINKKGEEE